MLSAEISKKVEVVHVGFLRQVIGKKAIIQKDGYL